MKVTCSQGQPKNQQKCIEGECGYSVEKLLGQQIYLYLLSQIGGLPLEDAPFCNYFET
jgi:hypothetical protein